MLLIVLFLFIFGLVIGSFLNVVILRTLQEESPLEGRSRCDECRRQINWYDNIPLLSYIVLGGKCRYCKKPIDITHPVVEFMTGALFVWWYLGGFFFFQFFKLSNQPFQVIQPVFWLVVGIILLIILVTDLISFIIPDYAVLALFFLSYFYRVALVAFGIMQVQDFALSLVGSLVVTAFFFSLWYFTKGKGMGFGDVKFCLPMGLLLGWPNIFVGMFLAFVIGAVVGIVVVVWKKSSLKAKIPFGPFLVLGTVITLMYGDGILQWYLGLL